MQTEWLDYQAVADLTGLTLRSVYAAQGRATANRAVKRFKEGDMPPPDQYFGRTPVWRKETIEQWRDQVRKPSR